MWRLLGGGSIGDTGVVWADLEGSQQDSDVIWLPGGNCVCPNYVSMESNRRANYAFTSGSGVTFYKKMKPCFV